MALWFRICTLKTNSGRKLFLFFFREAQNSNPLKCETLCGFANELPALINAHLAFTTLRKIQVPVTK